MKPTKEVETHTPAERSHSASSGESSTPADKASKQPASTSSEPIADMQQIDEIFSSLKTLLSTVEKLQKARQEVGDIKPLVGRLLDGELVSGDELEQLKVGVGGLSRLVRSYTDYQVALDKAQPARNLLDQVLKG
ncbi:MULTISPECIES: hypothetical protein [unclassified Leptolyngbya]|uniref:hypothetical protein n=1 Tax=unclassified Leptolyngbya TaxID=2650499 RepID=UPI0018EF88B6|nr:MULTISPECIES: hypothetical protein [unclassified Leptolyngbya]